VSPVLVLVSLTRDHGVDFTSGAATNTSLGVIPPPHPRRSVIHHTIRRRPPPPPAYSPDIRVIVERCRSGGGEEAAIALLPDIFATGVSEHALTTRTTMASGPGAGTHHHHDRGGRASASASASAQAYRVLLRSDGEDRRFNCRLCAVGTNGHGWRNARDVLRHLKRDHFGLRYNCSRW